MPAESGANVAPPGVAQSTFTSEASPATGENSTTALPLLAPFALSESRLNAAGARESVSAGLKPDLMFRLGSKHRLRNTGDGWELYKFTDAAYESRTQKNNGLAVELFFPFH